MFKWWWGYNVITLLCLFVLSAHSNDQEQVEGFFSQSGHTNNWAVLVNRWRADQKESPVLTTYYLRSALLAFGSTIVM